MEEASWVPPDPPRSIVPGKSARNPWPATIQNVLAMAATVTLALTDKITGNTAAIMILATLGVIALPAVLTKGKGGAGGLGSVGIFALVAKPAITLALAVLPRVAS